MLRGLSVGVTDEGRLRFGSEPPSQTSHERPKKRRARAPAAEGLSPCAIATHGGVLHSFDSATAIADALKTLSTL
jgi:hypothetical protein